MEVKLPVPLGTQLQRAAYWTSAPHVAELQAWAKKWGDGPVVKLREAERNGVPAGLAGWAAMGATPAPREELARRDALREKIVTTADLLREALQRALSAPAPRARSRAAKKPSQRV